MAADAGRPGPLSGDGYELRELRDHQPGDPFKRIAWKASARHGTLLVRDHEREERDVVWLLLDASGAATETLGADSLPTHLLLDAEGNVVLRAESLDEDVIRDLETRMREWERRR